MELVVMADAELLFGDYLRVGLAGLLGRAIAVGTRLANLPARPAESVLLFRTGGPARTLVSDGPQLTLETRAPLESKAWELMSYGHALMLAAGRLGVILPGGHQVHSVIEFAGPANLPDPVTNSPRYTATYSAHIGASVVTT